jgi:hypothetical protein
MWPISIATERTRNVQRARTNLSVNRVMDATLHGPICLSNKRGSHPRPALDTLAGRVLRAQRVAYPRFGAALRGKSVN